MRSASLSCKGGWKRSLDESLDGNAGKGGGLDMGRTRINQYEAVVFDLDGTLLNTLEDLMDSVNFALSKYGMEKRGYE